MKELSFESFILTSQRKNYLLIWFELFLAPIISKFSTSNEINMLRYTGQNFTVDLLVLFFGKKIQYGCIKTELHVLYFSSLQENA